MNEKQEDLFKRISDTQYTWLKLRGIVQNEFNEDNPIPSMDEVMEWCDEVQNSIEKLEDIRYDVLKFLDGLVADKGYVNKFYL